MKSFLIILISLTIPILLYSQCKDCHTYYKESTIPCLLTANKKIRDTNIAIAPKNCNSFYFDSSANGLWKIYSFDTTVCIEIVEIKNGQRNGTDNDYFSNQKIKVKAEIKSGKLNGPYISYFENGKVNMQGHFENDKFTGTSTEYWDNGKIAHQMTFKNGSSNYNMDEKFWNSDGTSIDRDLFYKLWYKE
jgi:antitoxin component YwqK of YwqJK toxin-antitoxin module